MKVGRGFVGPMSYSHRKCTSRGRSSFLYTAELIVLGLSLLLAGCGQISLNQLLENEEPGEFRSTPSEANVPSGSTVTIGGKGGFKPYTYSIKEGSGDLDPSSGEYIAPGGIEKEQIEFIEVKDSFDQSDISTIHVFPPLSLKVNGKLLSRITIDSTQTVDFDADGGSAATGYDYYLDGVSTFTSPLSGLWTFDPPAIGTYLVEVQDDLENSAVATVEVVRADLQITPANTDVYQGGTVSFKGLNVIGTAVYAASPAVGSFAPSGDDAVYTAPAAPFTGTVTVTLSDASQSVTAAVQVLVDDPGVLAITPTNTDVFQEGTVSFKGLNVIGTAVYAASPAVGSFAPSGDDAEYTAPAAPFTGTVTVTLSDDKESATATVQVMAMDPGDLAIDPIETQVQWGGTVSFTGINVQGTAVYAASPAVGSFAPSGDDADYTAPPDPFTGEVTVTLTDDSESVTATVHVLDVDPATLELVLSPKKVDLIWGDEHPFTASGGIGPYTFWLGDGAKGILTQISDTEAVYEAPYANTTDWVWVEDSVGTTPESAKAKVKAK
jgi:hypothetical protein